MKVRRATLASAAMLLGLVAAPGAFAESGGRHSVRSGNGGSHSHPAHRAGGPSGIRFAAPYRARAIPRAAFPAAPLAYLPPAYYIPSPAYDAPPSYASVPPPVYYVPPISPNAPLFSFDGSPEEPEWNWRRVSLQQLVAEVRAKREAGRKP